MTGRQPDDGKAVGASKNALTFFGLMDFLRWRSVGDIPASISAACPYDDTNDYKDYYEG